MNQRNLILEEPSITEPEPTATRSRAFRNNGSIPPQWNDVIKDGLSEPSESQSIVKKMDLKIPF